MSLNYQEALAELRNNVSSYQTPDSLANLVNQVSADTTGKITMLYGGSPAEGLYNNQILKGMMENGENLRLITDTSAAKFLESEAFEQAAAKAHGVKIEEISTRGSEINKWFNDAGTGRWADVSKNFVDATQGEIRTLTRNAPIDRIFGNDELPHILKKADSTVKCITSRPLL